MKPSAKMLPFKGKNAKWVKTTPQMAAVWFANRAHNRTISAAMVDRYAGDMLAGEWKQSGEPIIFDDNGQCIDGQHRLSAQVKAGITLEWLIVEGVSNDAIQVIDTGGIRSHAAVEEIAHGTKRAGFRIAIIHAIRSCAFKVNFRLSAYRRHEMVAALQSELDWAAATIRGKSIARNAPVSAALAFAHHRYPDAVDAFTMRLASGAGLQENDPAYVLREWLLFTRGVVNGATRVETFIKVLVAIKAHVDRRRIKILRVGKGVNIIEHFSWPEIEALMARPTPTK